LDSISRVLSAIVHEPTAPIPRGELVLDHAFITQYLCWKNNLGEIKHLSPIDRIIACCRSLQLDIVCLQPGASIRSKSGQIKFINEIKEIASQGFFVFWVVNGVFQSMMDRRGPMPFLLDIARSPENVCESLHHLMDQVIGSITQGIDAGAHGVIIADDIACQRNTYISPEFVERYLLPIWQRQIEAAKELGVPVFYHSDGDISAVLPLIVEAGFDGLQCIEPTAGMDIFKIKRQYGQDLCLMGNVDPALLSDSISQSESRKSHDNIRHAVTNLLSFAGEDGGFIFGTSSGLYSGMNPELVHFMYNIVADAE
jgi:uroporphyrinogen decarboxylase